MEKCKIPALFQNFVYVDFSVETDFDLKFGQLIEALDIPKQKRHREYFDDERNRTDVSDDVSDGFVKDLAELYSLQNCKVRTDYKGVDLYIEKKDAGFRALKSVVICREKRVDSDDSQKIVDQQKEIEQHYPDA